MRGALDRCCAFHVSEMKILILEKPELSPGRLFISKFRRDGGVKTFSITLKKKT